MPSDRILNTTPDITTLSESLLAIPGDTETPSGGASPYNMVLDGIADARGHATLQAGFEQVLSEGLPREDYLDFLYNLYHIVWHFCPVLAAAASRCGDEYRELRYHLYHQIDDEKGHENWVLEDIENMGGDVEYARASRPGVAIDALIGYNYYVAEHVSPWAATGMMHVLEETAASYAARVATVTAERLDVDDITKGFKFLSSHAEMDAEHISEFEKIVNTTANPAAVQAIVAAGRVNYALFFSLFREF
ncbi:MAG: iron-containing redox enzyme family protein [Pseudomonadota bacterium]